MMNISKTLALIIAALVAVSISLLILQLLLKKLSPKSGDEGQIKMSFGIWFSTLFIAFSIITYKTIIVLSEAIDNIYKIFPTNAIMEVFKTTALFIGLSTIWFLIWYWVVKALVVMIAGKRIDVNEMETNHSAYFLMKGILVVGFVLGFSSVFEILLRGFMPEIEIPFYR